MKERRGEKIGWIGGWTGSFLWLCLLSVLWLAQGKMTNGILGLILFAVAILLIFIFAPWKYPEIKYWKLMLPIYVVFLISLSLYIFLSGGPKMLGLSWWSIFLLLPVFIPFATVGKRCWNNVGKKEV